MMKVETSELHGKALLLVEGRLAGAFVPELEASWRAAQASHPPRGIAVDLKNVTCVDRAGRSLLRSMHNNGVEFLRAGIALQDILDQIIDVPE
ncbi:MAG TPA: hypothetical protein VLZ50_14025 [Terracidiphilus sp.]|nr:hypothetical protein [Terracidiphilus sp.]